MAITTIPGVANPMTSAAVKGRCRFAYVYFENAMAKGEPCQWSDTAGNLGFGVEDTVANSTRVAGVVVEAVSASTWGWIQTAGYCDYIITDGNVAAPNADTLQGDIGLLATSTPTAAGATAAELDGTAGLYKACFATNLAADDSTPVGYCILHCNYH